MGKTPSGAPQFFRVAALPAVSPIPGVAAEARFVAGERLMALFARVEPNESLPLHRHPHEQITYVTEGTVHFRVGEEGFDLGAGEGLAIPGGMEHGGVRVGPQGCSFIEIFTPLRDDYLALMRRAERGT